MVLDRTSVFPKAFSELAFGLSDVLKVGPFTFYHVYKIFGVARYGVGDFSSFVPSLVFKKGQRGWLHFLIPVGCWPEKFSCRAVSNRLADHQGLRYVCKL